MIYRESTVTINPPKECLLYKSMVNLNDKFNQQELEIKEKSNNTRELIKEMKEELNKIKNKRKIRFSEGTYYGQTIGDKNEVTGLGVFENDDGRKYEGQFLDCDRDGIGIFTGTNKDAYYGEFKKNKRSGFGIEENIIDPYDSKYEGEWLDDGINGNGIIVYTDGRIYIGSLDKGKLSGEGKIIFIDGSYFIGEFKEDLKV